MNIRVSRKVFNDVYVPSLLSYDTRYEVYYGGAGSGKSHFVAQKLVFKAIREQRKILVLRKVGRTVKQSIFQMLLDTLSFFKILDKCKVNRTDFSIELPNGSIFIATGLDDSEKIKSITSITDIWMEEATEFIQDDFNQLDLRLRHPTATGQQIILSFNPVSKVNWCYKLFFKDEWDAGEEAQKAEMLEFRKKAKILHTNYLDNRFLPQPYIDSLLLLKATNPAYFTIYALGNFGSLDKLIFNNWQVQEFDYKKINGELMVGLDFGFVNDTTALTCSLMDEKNKRIYIFQEWGDTGLLNNEIAAGIKALGLNKSTIIADSAEQKSIEEIKRAGVPRIKPAIKGQGSILQGIQKLQQYEIVIQPDCRNIIEEFKNYSWKKDKKTNEYLNSPIDNYNHYIDALRYSLQCVEQNPKVKTINKAAFGF